ncbi:Forkhead box protein K2 [Blastocladiella emersonii ATCC 22665]|nr:Forkhead box protein K2 [Blastocladiella emersonii ATCC 22665]
MVETSVTDPANETVHLGPAASYPQLIAQAFAATPSRQLTVREMCDWVQSRYPFYRYHNVSGGVRPNNPWIWTIVAEDDLTEILHSHALARGEQGCTASNIRLGQIQPRAFFIPSGRARFRDHFLALTARSYFFPTAAHHWHPKPSTATDPADGTVHLRPAASYPQLIAQALAAAPNRQLTVREMLDWVLARYPYYRLGDVAKVLVRSPLRSLWLIQLTRARALAA